MSQTPPESLFRVFLRIGLLSFGGPAAQIALMHEEIVTRQRWMTEAQFLRALSFCMLLPGPEAMQLATYAGWQKAGIRGGLIAGGLFVIPGALVIAALAFAYVAWGEVPLVEALFVGVKAAVIVIVVQALWKIAKRALKERWHLLVAVTAFAALFVFGLPFPLVIGVAALTGALLAKPDPAATVPPPAPALRRGLVIAAIGLVIWFAPILAAHLTGAEFLRDLGLFFAKLATVTFGGAYAVLTWMTQEVVQLRGWLTTAQMVDALGLAETTPGPLILVTQFVGMVTGLERGGAVLGLAAGAMTLWATFVPCFIWIFAGAPLIAALEHRPRLEAALAGVTAAVVGVVANLSLWFAFTVLFAETRAPFAPLPMLLPAPETLQLLPLGLAGLAALLLVALRLPLPLALIATAAAAALLSP